MGTFSGKTALVTGAAVGIGRAVALKLAEEGARLALVDINEEKLGAVREECLAYGCDALVYRCDVSDESAVSAAVADAFGKLGSIDLLVNNAALWRCNALFIDTPVEEWKRFFDVNVMGTVYVTRAVLPKMLERQYGRIINVASVAGVYGNRKMAHYSATKGAVISFTKALAKEVADSGVLVNAVSPGTVSPSENEDLDFTKPSELSYLGRTGSDRENADLIAFLLSDAASYITGQNIQIDGGRRRI